MGSYDKAGRCVYQQSPYFEEKLIYDPAGNLTEKGNSKYTYDAASQLTSEKGVFDLCYDLHANRISENQKEIHLDELNQRQDEAYDPNGNLVREGFTYDEFDQLIQTNYL